MGSCCSRVGKNKLVADEGVSRPKRPASASQVTLADKIHERCLNKEKMYKNEVKKLEKQLKDLEKLTKDKAKEIIALKENHYQQMEKQIINHEHESKVNDETISTQREQIRKLKEENNTLLTRLSAIASAKLTDGNPNIADLSDVNRPTKLAEQYSELYDNQWTDAFDVIHGVETEENACQILLDLLCNIYTVCIKKAGEERETLVNTIKTFLGNNFRRLTRKMSLYAGMHNGQETPVDVIKLLKDRRKKTTSAQISILKKELKGHVTTILPVKQLRRDKKVKQFLNKCIDLCWHMAVQDPPVFVDVNTKRSDQVYDSTMHKAYTKSGIYIAYIVWPTLFLHENGNILCKGVAQCKAEKSNQSCVHSLTTPFTEKGMGPNNHSNKDYGTFNKSGTSSTLIAAPDVVSVTEEHGEKCITNHENQVFDSSLHSLNNDTQSNTHKLKKRSLGRKVKAKQDNLENTSTKCFPHQMSPNESKEDIDYEETLKSPSKHQDCLAINSALIAEDDLSNDREIPNKNCWVKNEINRATTPIHIHMHVNNSMEKINRSSSVKF